jgi:hypothetical protein
MSLQEAVLDVAREMEEEITRVDSDTGSLLYGYVVALKAAVKAAGPYSYAVSRVPDSAVGGYNALVAQEKAALRELGKRVSQEEMDSSRLTEVVGGPGGDSWAPRHPQMPVGAMCSIAGGLYELRDDGKLHFVPPG